MIVIVNYGIGNLDSVTRAFRTCKADVIVSARPEDLEGAGGIVLPGVGSFDKAIQCLKETGLLALLSRKVLDEGTPILGICLGFQLLTKHSEEGGVAGLGWIDAETKRFDFAGMDPCPKIPHIGWNDLAARTPSPLFEGIDPKACFYFAHSYYVSCADPAAVLCTTEYGREFTSGVALGNIFGTQFHPEKSHANGLRLVRNFIAQVPHA